MTDPPDKPRLTVTAGANTMGADRRDTGKGRRGEETQRAGAVGVGGSATDTKQGILAPRPGRERSGEPINMEMRSLAAWTASNSRHSPQAATNPS